MTDSNSYSEFSSIDDIADSFVARLRNGEHPSINEYVERFPNHEEAIRELFPTLAQLEDIQSANQPDGDAQPFGDEIQLRENIGEYELVREIGRGGMGIVYEARHETMRRRVALKVLPASAAQIESNVKRFHREARAAGQLHHTNIVPVFEVGRSNDIYFYAMQYIHGQNLDVVIDEMRYLQTSQDHTMAGGRGHTLRNDVSKSIALSLVSGVLKLDRTQAMPSPTVATQAFSVESPEASNSSESVDHGVTAAAADFENGQAIGWRPTLNPMANNSSTWTTIGDENETYYQRVARVGLQVAQALDYAHQHGVVHRDIKPSNLILDTDGIVWVTDFGLAKEEGDNLTHTGDIVGTLRYMAPERFKRPADWRSDIYSVGLTLYELCTLQHAFEHSDRANLVKQISEHSPPSPRKIQPQTPRDLETIILKAIDREPNRRYASARDFAHDLQRFISDRPIAARRVTSAERVWRWCRRNPVPATLATCIVILLVAGAVGLGRFAYVKAKYASEVTKYASDLKRAERRNLAHLHRAKFDEGKALRWSGRQGQNFQSRESLAMAAKLLPSIQLPEKVVDLKMFRLRNEAAASMALLDLKEVNTWAAPNGFDGAFAFNDQLTQYARSDDNGNIVLVQLDDQSQLATLPSPGEQAWRLLFSPNGRYLIAKYHHAQSVYDVIVCLWDLESQTRLLTIDSEVSGRFGFLPDSSQVSVGRTSGQMEFYSTGDGSLLHTLDFETEQPFDWHFDLSQQHFAMVSAPKGNLGITSGKDEITFRSVMDGSIASKITAPADITDVVWNERQQKIAASCADHNIYIWNSTNRESDEPSQTLVGHSHVITHIALRHRGDILISRSWDGSTRMFDLNSGNQVLRIEGVRLAKGEFDSSDLRIPFGSKLAEIDIWQLPDDRPLRAIDIGRLDSSRHACVFHPIHGQLIFYPSSRGITVVDIQNYRFTDLAVGPMIQLSFTEDGNTMFTSGDNGIQKWSLSFDQNEKSKTDVCVALVETIDDRPTRKFDFSEKHQLIAYLLKGRWHATIARLDHHAAVTRFEKDRFDIGNHTRSSSITLSRCGRFAFTTTWQGEGVKVWDTSDGRLVTTLLPDIGTCSVAAHPDGQHILVQSGAERWKIDLSSMDVVQRWPRQQPDGWAGSIRFSPTESIMICAYSRFKPQIIDAVTGETVTILEAPESITLGSISFSSDGRYFAIAEKGDIRIWDLWQLRRNYEKDGIDWVTDTPLPPFDKIESAVQTYQISVSTNAQQTNDRSGGSN